ncbi:putative pre-rRNA-processing protein ESF1 [Cocos nucifera]|uniref:Putative pre-rRNA-processing protein ESF1 n=1 Tax=Cocos nucifera TaxID=13894 RepID=A0A8K0I1V0_COCNU|nr:putative pre-rRNA-processing protein ESF1 [Cocos nucifera]
MASTSNGDKKRKKEKKNKNLQERPENDEFEDIKKKKNKKQRLQPLAEQPAAAREVEDKVKEKHGKKQNKKKDKTKVKKERNRQDGREPKRPGDIVDEKKKRNGRIMDPRFSSAHFDPRFHRMPKRESKVVIDSRFTRMFSDKNFSTFSAPVDKRGKARKEKGVNPLLHYYLHQEAEGDEETETKEEETDELREGSPELPRKASSSESELEVSEEDLATSESDESTSTSEEEDYDDDEYSVGSDICQYLMADHKDTPMTDKVTYRLAVVNMDWDHIKAVDLYVVMSSCLPKGGQVLSVAVYPSEFGLKCMEIEAVHGPSGLLDGNEEHSDDDSDIYNEKLRIYELNKLRYYYAVVVCDSSATADHIYTTLDGTEFLKTSNVFDLQFIPDTMEFKHPPRDITTEVPTSYKEPDFHTRALQHSKVKLSWEEDEPERTKILRRKFNPNQLDELNEYLASSGDSDEGDDNGGENGFESDDAAASPNGEEKRRIAREKLRALLQSGDDSDAEHGDDKDMEITFNTELDDLGKRILEKKDKKSETVWEAVLRKRSEKKKARKRRSKYSSEDDSSDYDVQEAPDQPDDFFAEEPSATDTKVNKKNSKELSKTKVKDMEKEQEASRAELELLLAEDQGAEHGPKGYNLKPKKVKGKTGKEKPSDDKLPDVNIADDPRFSALFSSHHFAMDPTDPQFKRSAAYIRQRQWKQQSGAGEEATMEEAANSSEQVPSDDRIPAKNDILDPTGASLEREKNEFSSTVCMKNNWLFFTNVDIDGECPYIFPTEFQLSQGFGLNILSQFGSLVDSSFHRSNQIYVSGSLALQEAFSCMSKFAGALFVWISTGSNSNLLRKLSGNGYGSSSTFNQSCTKIKHFTCSSRNLAGLHSGSGSNNELAIPVLLAKFVNSTIGRMWKEVEQHRAFSVLSLAAALIPPFDNIRSSKVLAESIPLESTDERISGLMDRSCSEDDYRGCSSLSMSNITWKRGAVEPKTGIKFPSFLEDNSSLTAEVLVGTGSRSMRIIRLKSMNIYAFGLYVQPDSVCEKLGPKYSSVPVSELQNCTDFFEDLLSAFEKSLRTRLLKMNPDTDYHCLRAFGSYFTQDIPLPMLVINILVLSTAKICVVS